MLVGERLAYEAKVVQAQIIEILFSDAQDVARKVVSSLSIVNSGRTFLEASAEQMGSFFCKEALD